MAKDQTRPLSDSTLKRDRDALVAVASITGFAPANPACTVTNLQASQTAMTAAQTAETEARNALKAADDDSRQAEWDFHNLVLAAKDKVKAQFGPDSNEVQSIGLKKIRVQTADAKESDKSIVALLLWIGVVVAYWY